MGPLLKDTSSAQARQPILPNQWTGETDCIIGPFTGRNVAELFVNRAVDFGHYETFHQRIFEGDDAWFIEVQPVEAEKADEGYYAPPKLSRQLRLMHRSNVHRQIGQHTYHYPVKKDLS
jgi:hypothetical protein